MQDHLVKKRIIDLLKFSTLFFSGFSLIFILYQYLLPFITEYFKRLSIFWSITNQNRIIIITTFILLFIIFYTLSSCWKKIKFLLSEITTDQTIYDECVDAWKKEQYHKVYEGILYLYDMGNKQNIESPYIISAKAILLFQETDLHKEEISKHEIISIIENFLIANERKELFLNNVHLAFCFSHLSKVIDNFNQKATCHLLSSLLFRTADERIYKKEAEREYRIFNAYLEAESKLMIDPYPGILNDNLTNLDIIQERQNLYRLLEDFIKQVKYSTTSIVSQL